MRAADGFSPFATGSSAARVSGNPPYFTLYPSVATLIVRSDATAEASFAAILARRRFGIAIAAMIKTTGKINTPIYPSTSPAMAIPAPMIWPPLRRIRERDMWPVMIAAMPARGTRNKMPQIRLTIAKPLVLGSPGPDGVLGANSEYGNSRPHHGQKRTPCSSN